MNEVMDQIFEIKRRLDRLEWAERERQIARLRERLERLRTEPRTGEGDK